VAICAEHRRMARASAAFHPLMTISPARWTASAGSRNAGRGVGDGADTVALTHRCRRDFNPASLPAAYRIKCRMSTQRTQAPESVDTRKSLPPMTPWRTPSVDSDRPEMEGSDRGSSLHQPGLSSTGDSDRRNSQSTKPAHASTRDPNRLRRPLGRAGAFAEVSAFRSSAGPARVP
jgi:hypothetical protein